MPPPPRARVRASGFAGPDDNFFPCYACWTNWGDFDQYFDHLQRRHRHMGRGYLPGWWRWLGTYGILPIRLAYRGPDGRHRRFPTF